MSESIVDVVIVGAGLAGLSAARRLQALGKSFVVLEARDRVGGRTFTEEFTLGSSEQGQTTKKYWIDSGGQWLSPTQTVVRKLADEVNVKTFPGAPQKGKMVLVFKGEYYEMELEGGEQNACFSIMLEQFKRNFSYDYDEYLSVEKELDKMAMDFHDGKPWESPNAKEWDSMSTQTWIDANVKTDGAKYILQVSCLLAFAATPSDLSLLHLLFYIHCAGSFGALHKALAYRLEGGAQEISIRVANELGDKVKLENPVRDIIHSDNQVTVKLANGDEYEAQEVIVAVPPAIIQSIHFDPPLPAGRRQLNQRMPMGSSVKCHLVYDEPFWRKAGYSGMVYSDQHVLPFITDNENPGQDSPGILGCFLDANTAREYMDRPLIEIKQMIIKAVEDIYEPIMGTIPKPAKVHVIRWADQQWSDGAYAGVMPTGVWTGYKNVLREPVGRIHWAGTETAKRWFAYMDGAVRSGQDAVKEIYDE
ncbi:MAG: hypothetical protein COA42_14080 [Alteromonadaceae bacterium]|nr:MAG: hypothetical protein COA42_14080 [Alteromonadaceae bacterium]